MYAFSIECQSRVLISICQIRELQLSNGFIFHALIASLFLID